MCHPSRYFFLAYSCSDIGLLWRMMTTTMTAIVTTMMTAVKSTEYYPAGTGMNPLMPIISFKPRNCLTRQDYYHFHLTRDQTTHDPARQSPSTKDSGLLSPRWDLPRKHWVRWPGFCRGCDFRFQPRAPWRSWQRVLHRPRLVRKYFPCRSQEMLFIFNFFFPGLGFVFRQEEVKLLFPTRDCPSMAQRMCLRRREMKSTASLIST